MAIKKNNFVIILSLLGVAIAVLMISILEDNLTIFIMFLLFLLLGGVICYLEDKSLISKVFIPAFIIRILFVSLLYYILIYFNGIPFIINITGTTDDYHYFEIGKEVCNTWMKHMNYNWTKEFNFPGYIYLIGGLNYFTNLFGQFHQIIILFLNCLAGSISIIYVYKISQLVFDDKVAKTASTICIYFPYLLYYSSLILKDTIIYTLILAIIYYIYYLYYNKFNTVYLTLVFLLSYLLLYFRSESLYLIIVILGLFLATRLRFKQKPRILIRWIIYLMSFIVIGFKYNLYNNILNILNNIPNKILLWDARAVSLASSGSLAVKYIFTLPPVIKELVKVLYLLFTPFPFWSWNIKGTFNINLFCEGISNLVLNILLPFFIIGVIVASKKKFRRKSFLLLITTILFIVLLGILTPFARYRIQILPLIIIISAFGIVNKHKYRWIIELYFFLWCSLYIIYITIKYNFLGLLIFLILVSLVLFFVNEKNKIILKISKIN